MVTSTETHTGDAARFFPSHPPAKLSDQKALPLYGATFTLSTLIRLFAPFEQLNTILSGSADDTAWKVAPVVYHTPAGDRPLPVVTLPVVVLYGY